MPILEYLKEHPWIWGIIALVVVIIIVVIVVVVTSASAPLYKIQSVYAPDKYLDIVDNTLVVSTTGMSFSLSLDSTGTLYYVKSSSDSSKVLTYTSGTANSSLISLTANTKLPTQTWIIQPTQIDSDPNIFLSGQSLQFIPSTNTSMSMDFLNPQTTINYQVGLYTSNTGTNQKWMLIPA